MTSVQHRLILDLTLQRISEEQFLSEFPFDASASAAYLRQEIEKAFASRDAVATELILLLSKRFHSDAGLADVFRRLCFEDWHKQHENLASALQRLKDPLAVDGLYHMATSRYPYLEYDDSYALAVKCVWALSKINTPAAVERLNQLAAVNNEIVACNANQRLSGLQKKVS